jgi:hypothetical protein
VTVAFAGQTQSATADKVGAWCVKLAAMKANTTPAVMTVSGKNKLTLGDVVVATQCIPAQSAIRSWRGLS